MLAIKPFIGQHCETTTSGTLLYQQGIELSEPLLFGLGEGLSFIFWHMNSMPMPFIGGRVKPDQLTETLAKQLNLKLERQETSSSTKAWAIVKDLLVIMWRSMAMITITLIWLIPINRVALCKHH